MLTSQQRVALEKIIRSKEHMPDQKQIVHYLKAWFEDDMVKWVAGVESVNPERLRGEMACLKTMIEILSDSKLELFEGDK